MGASGQLPGQSDGIGEAVGPAMCLLAMVARRVAGGEVRGVVEAEAARAGQEVVAADGERRVQMQPERASARPIVSDDVEAAASRPGGEVQIGAVLDAEHRILAAHPLERLLPVAAPEWRRPSPATSSDARSDSRSRRPLPRRCAGSR